MKPAYCDSEELTRRARQGDPTLLSELFSCYREDLLGYMGNRCGNATDAEDAVQDAFVNATRAIDGFRGEAAIRTWLYRLAANACTRMRRAKRDDPSMHLSVDEAPIAQLQRTIDGVLEARLSPLQRALEGLSEKDRAVLLLRDGAGMKASEAAAELGLTEGAVKSRLHRARQAVRDEVGEL